MSGGSGDVKEGPETCDGLEMSERGRRRARGSRDVHGDVLGEGKTMMDVHPCDITSVDL